MREIEIERLLQWAYVELLKRGTVGTLAQSWDQVSDYGELLTRIDDDAALAMPAGAGPPHPDALTVERAVQGLQHQVTLDWREYRYLLMGDLPHLAPIASPLLRTRAARGSRNVANTPEWRACIDRAAIHQGEPVVFCEKTLVETCARKGARPDVALGMPQPKRIIGGNNRVAIIGESKGDGRYTFGSYCPLQYTGPTIEQLVIRRAEYLVWRGALDRVLGVLKSWTLRSWAPTKPDAPAVPWLECQAVPRLAPVPGAAQAWRTWPDQGIKRPKVLTR